jgi:hypothetical protein
MNCLGCNSKLSLSLLDLGQSPIANNFIDANKLKQKSGLYPLHVFVCELCALVQLGELLPRKLLFSDDYTYFSSYSSSWLEHSKNYVEKMISFLGLNSEDFVIEIASNDGYLLQFFRSKQIKVLGIEPAAGVGNVAVSKGIPTKFNFFGEKIALELAKSIKPKLIIGNNVLAHVPDLHDFIKGFAILIADEGVITFEFPHLLNLINKNEFDTIYHEHYSYLSATALIPIFTKYDLKVFDIEKLTTHGGSLRIFVAKKSSSWRVQKSVDLVIFEESKFDPRNPIIGELFRSNVSKIKNDLKTKLVELKERGKQIYAYGAAAKGVSLLNYCGIGIDLIECVVDLNPNKQGKFFPGSLIPIVGDALLHKSPPDILLVLPWNLSDEIKSQLSSLLKSGMKTIRAIPRVEYF